MGVRVPPSESSQYSKGFRLSAGVPFFVFSTRVAKKWLAGINSAPDRSREIQVFLDRVAIKRPLPPALILLLFAIPSIAAIRNIEGKAVSAHDGDTLSVATHEGTKNRVRL